MTREEEEGRGGRQRGGGEKERGSSNRITARSVAFNSSCCPKRRQTLGRRTGRRPRYSRQLRRRRSDGSEVSPFGSSHSRFSLSPGGIVAQRGPDSVRKARTSNRVQSGGSNPVTSESGYSGARRPRPQHGTSPTPPVPFSTDAPIKEELEVGFLC